MSSLAIASLCKTDSLRTRSPGCLPGSGNSSQSCWIPGLDKRTASKETSQGMGQHPGGQVLEKQTIMTRHPKSRLSYIEYGWVCFRKRESPRERTETGAKRSKGYRRVMTGYGKKWWSRSNNPRKLFSLRSRNPRGMRVYPFNLLLSGIWARVAWLAIMSQGLEPVFLGMAVVLGLLIGVAQALTVL